MARTTLTPNAMAANGILLNNAGTAIDAANGMTIPLPSTGFPAAPGPDTLLLYVQNTTGSTKTVTVRAGANSGTIGSAPPYTGVDPNAPAFRGGLGDLVTGNLTATTGTAFIGPFDVARFVQTDGSVAVDFASSMTGTIWAILLPKRF
jgi:hypothetical protein